MTATGSPTVTVSGKGTYRGSLEVRASGSGSDGDQRRRARGLRAGRGLEGVAGLLAARGPQGAGRRRPLLCALDRIRRRHLRRLRRHPQPGLRRRCGGDRQDRQAVNATHLQVVIYGARIAQTFFFSTSGGHTENNEFSSLGFGQPAIPYLRGVDDPYEADAGSPYEHWKRKFSIGRMNSALHSIGLRGKLKNIAVTQRGTSPRIVRANLVGTGGTATVNGPQLRDALGLPDTWAFFKKK